MSYAMAVTYVVADGGSVNGKMTSPWWWRWYGPRSRSAIFQTRLALVMAMVVVVPFVDTYRRSYPDWPTVPAKMLVPGSGRGLSCRSGADTKVTLRSLSASHRKFAISWRLEIQPIGRPRGWSAGILQAGRRSALKYQTHPGAKIQHWPINPAPTDPVPKLSDQRLARRNFIHRITALLCVMVISGTLTKFVLDLFDISSAWPITLAWILAFISGAIALAGNLFTAGALGGRPIAYLIYFAVLSTILLIVQSVVGERTVDGVARRDETVAASDISLLPFTIGVDPFAAGGCGTYIFDNAADNLKPVPDFSGASDSLDKWLRQHNAVQSINFGRGTFGKIILNISGGVDSPVTITGLSFQSLSHERQGAQGIVVSGHCGEGITGRFAEVDLDVDPPRIVASNTDPNIMWGSPLVQLVPLKFPYVVKTGTNEVFYIMAGTKGNASFRIRLDYLYQDRKGSAVIDDHGTPFRVGVPYDGQSAYQNSYLLTSGQLIPPGKR